MKLKLVASGFLNSMRNFFSGKSEGEADQSVDGQETSKPPAEFTPSALLEGVKDYYQAKPFMATRSERIANEEYHYREEHEPYRLEPDGDKIVCISKAFLYEVHPLTAEVKRHPLTPLSIEVESTCVVYSTFKTDDHGRIKVEEGADAYTLGVEEGEDLPEPTHFELPDGEGGEGVDGEYYVAICYIKNYKFSKWQVSEPAREAKLAGGLEGQRGPMWWVSGYNALRNIGGGNGKIYKEYKLDADFKDLRTLAEKGLDRNCSGGKNISGVPQIKVTQAAETIEIGGNGFSTSWKVGDKKMAIVEDGLVRCLEDLPVQELEQVEVVTAPTASGNYDTNVSVAACPTEEQKGTAWTGGATNSQMIQGTPRTNMWAGGNELNLPWVQICISSTTYGAAPTCYWVLGTESSSTNAPVSVNVINGADTVVGVESVVQVTGVADTSSSGLLQVDIIKDLTCVTVVASSATSTSTAWVLRSGGTNVKVVKEATGDMCDDCPEE